MHLDFAAPAKAWDAYRPLRILAYELLRAAIDDGSIRADLDPDLVAGLPPVVGPHGHRDHHRRHQHRAADR